MGLEILFGVAMSRRILFAYITRLEPSATALLRASTIRLIAYTPKPEIKQLPPPIKAFLKLEAGKTLYMFL
jgi:hypothetical protein